MQQPLLPTTVTAFSQTMLRSMGSCLGDEEGSLWECVINGSGLWRGRHDLKGIA